MSTVTRDAEGTVTGNTYDKYGSTNPVVKRLWSNFEGTLEALSRAARPASLLDVGCGEGVLTHKWAQRIDGRVVGIDLDDPQLHEVVLGEQRATTEAMHETAKTIFGEDFPRDREQGRRWATALSAIRGIAVLKMLGHPAAAVDRQWAATRGQLIELLG